MRREKGKEQQVPEDGGAGGDACRPGGGQPHTEPPDARGERARKKRPAEPRDGTGGG